MSCHLLIGNLKQVKGAVGDKGKLTDDNVYVIAGKRDIFFGKIQGRDTASHVKSQKRNTSYV
ncbi:MAG: general stress protein CsbD [Syntrophobacteraceae bacterium]